MKSINGEKKITEDGVEKLVSILGAANVRKCEDCGATVISPNNNEQLGEVVRMAMQNDITIMPKAMIGGCKAGLEGSIVVDMSNMASVIDVDTVHKTATVQVGCKMKTFLRAINAEGYCLGVRPAGEDPTVEDWIYTEEAGIGSYKYGTVKDSVYNIVAVDYAGRTITTGYDKIGYNMSGYNMIQALCASYGRLAIATTVTFKIQPKGVVEAVAYQVPNTGRMQEALMKVAQHPSMIPMHISYNENLLVFGFQGDKEFVDLDIKQLDALMAEVGAEKSTQEVADEKFDNIPVGACMNLNALTVYIPLKNYDAYVASIREIADFKIAGNVPDKRTVVIKITGDVDAEAFDKAADKAAEFGGRASSKCPSKYRTEETNKYSKRIEQSFLGAKPEEKELSRKVDDKIIEKLKEAVGAKNVNVNGMDRVLYSHDMAPLPKEAGLAFNNIPDVVVRPETTAHVANVVRIAYENGIAVTPRGNGSWGLGGCMPTNAGIILDMPSKCNKIIEFNAEELYVKVQAGITFKRLLEYCMKRGYIIGSYPSSFPSATVAAWYQTNGMGIGSYKYNGTKDNLLNATVVVDNGDVVVTGFDNIGSYRTMYNLTQFFSGAEGTLGFVTEMTFRIFPMGKIRCLAYEFDNLKDIDGPLQELVAHASVKPLHVAWSDYLHFRNQHRAGVHAPDVKNLWLVTLQGDDEHNDLEEAAVTAMAEAAGGRKVATEIAEHEWEERCYEFRARKVGVGEIPGEVIVPTVSWGVFTDECYEGFDKMRMEAGGIIGVMSDRSTALFMPYYFKDDELLTGMLSFGFNFYLGDRAALYGGRTTGFGVFFNWMMDVIHDSSTAAMERQIKTVLDPNDVVNPGHVVCGMTRFGVDMNKTLMGLGSTLMQTIKQIFPKDRAFSSNLLRFRYDDLEKLKVQDRVHKLGDGTQ